MLRPLPPPASICLLSREADPTWAAAFPADSPWGCQRSPENNKHALLQPPPQRGVEHQRQPDPGAAPQQGLARAHHVRPFLPHGGEIHRQRQQHEHAEAEPGQGGTDRFHHTLSVTDQGAARRGGGWGNAFAPHARWAKVLLAGPDSFGCLPTGPEGVCPS